MIIDNFELLANLKDFWNFNPNGTGNTHGYSVEILRRNKDQKENDVLKGVTKEVFTKKDIIDIFLIYSVEELMDCKEYIIRTCNFYNARAYISVNPINPVHYLKKMIHIYFDALTTIYEYPGSLHFSHQKQHWKYACETGQETFLYMIDCDTFDEKQKNLLEKIINVGSHENKILFTIPTLNGCHYITKPFNASLLEENIKQNNINAEYKEHPLTLLYFNKKEE